MSRHVLVVLIVSGISALASPVLRTVGAGESTHLSAVFVLIDSGMVMSRGRTALDTVADSVSPSQMAAFLHPALGH